MLTLTLWSHKGLYSKVRLQSSPKIFTRMKVTDSYKHTCLLETDLITVESVIIQASGVYAKNLFTAVIVSVL